MCVCARFFPGLFHLEPSKGCNIYIGCRFGLFTLLHSEEAFFIYSLRGEGWRVGGGGVGGGGAVNARQSPLQSIVGLGRRNAHKDAHITPLPLLAPCAQKVLSYLAFT